MLHGWKKLSLVHFMVAARQGTSKSSAPNESDGTATSSRAALAIGTGTSACSDFWIMYSVSSVHLVKRCDDAEECEGL